MDHTLAKIINTSQYVSFDIFDTAIIRNVLEPSDVFALVQKQYEHCHSELLPNYPKLRQKAEKKSREKLWRRKQASEVTLDTIFECLVEDFGLNDQTAQILKKIEIETEGDVCRRNQFIFSVYNYCRENHKQIIFISDMYLPLSVINKILHAAGYDQSDKLFLSSAIGKTKFVGDIYPYVVKQLGCNPEHILHIGDNYQSDVLNAKANGLLSYFYENSRHIFIKSYWFKKEKFHKLVNKTKSLDSSFYLATIINQYYCDTQDNNTSDEEDFWYNFGFKNVGILFLSFMNWLLDATTKDGIDKIFFLSRDGYIMHKVYYLLAGYRDNSPRADYMYASRRALNIPSIFELNDVAMDFLASGTSILTVSQFLERIDLDPNQYRQEIQSAGFVDSHQKVKTQEDYINLNKLYKLLASEILQLACSERINLLNYLKSIGLLDKKRIAIVDIGWNGTMQYSLSTLLKKIDKNIEIKGYYFGILRQAKKNRKQGMDMSSYLIDLGKPKYYKNLVKLCLPFLEFIHAAPHGSVHNYACIGQEVKPVLDEHDLSLQDRKKALLIQKGALEFISQYQKYIQNYPFIKPLKKMATQPLYRVLKNPTLYEAEKLGDIEHSESFGNINDKRYIAKPPTDIPLLVLRFDKLFSSFKSSYWRRGYIKRLLANIYSF